MDVKEFAKFEEQERLFNREYGGIPYWQYLRGFVYNYVSLDRFEKETAAGNKQKLHQKMSNWMYSGIKGIKSELALKKQTAVDVILFRIFEGPDRFYDYWNLPEKITAIRIMRNMAVEKASPPGIFYMGLPSAISAVTNFVQKKLHRRIRDEKEFRFLKELEQKVICRFGKCMTAGQMQELIQGYLNSKTILRWYYGRLFDHLKPRAIVVTMYPNSILYAAYEEARNRGIKIIALQHCLIYNHPWYWFEDQRGLNNPIPDYMLLFGRVHETWTKFPQNTTCVSVGFPFQEHELKRLEQFETDEKAVIVYPTSDERFEMVISEFIDKADPLGYKVIMKVHPGEESDNLEIYYPLLSKKKNLDIITDQSKGIYYWLKRGKHHVMVNSTVGYEALAVDGSNICIAQNVKHEMMQPLLDWGIARGFQTADELLELICHPLETDTLHRRELWEENASENMERFFRQMQEQGWPDGKDFRQ